MKRPDKKIFRRIFVGFAPLFALVLAGGDLAKSQANSLNYFLNVKTYELVETGDGSQDTNYFPSAYESAEQVKAAFKIKAIQAEEEGLVLLKNENGALPLSPSTRLALLGQGTVKTNYSGSGSASIGGASYPSMKESFEKCGFSINPTIHAFYTNGPGKNYGRKTVSLIGQINECPWSEFGPTEINSFNGDAAIVTFSRDAGEGDDVAVKGSDTEDGSTLALSAGEDSLLRGLSEQKAAGKISKIIVLLNMAVPMETDFLFRSGIDVDACLWIGNVGSYGLEGVANVLKGNVSPSGKLMDTFLRDNMSSPAMMNWMDNADSSFSTRYANYKEDGLNTSQRYYASYDESIYIGYRYYETRYEDVVTHRPNAGDFDYDSVVSFPFGHGLSYASFSYHDFAVEKVENGYRAKVKVKNDSTQYSGKEAVGVYLSKPYGDYEIENGIEVSSVELAGFAKTLILTPGQEETVSIEIPAEYLKTYDAKGAGTYILSAGDYYLSVGKSSHDAVNNLLAKRDSSSLGDASLSQKIHTQASRDEKTYSVSLETGKPIVNRMDFMDMNRYDHRGENKTTYVSRSNWIQTLPVQGAAWVANSEMLADLAPHHPHEPGTQQMPNYEVNNPLQLAMLREKYAYDDPIWQDLLDQMSFAEQAYLLTTAAYSTVTIPSVGKPATKDCDGPIACVNTTTGSVLPGKNVIAATWNVQLIEEIGEILAEDTRLAGFNSLYAPGINIHRTPFGGRATEYYSEDPILSGYACVAEVKGLQTKGIVPTVKHFAFNNEETRRNGIGIWMNEQTAREIYLRPYEMAMRPSIGNCHAIMTSFNRAGAIWTSASRELMIEFNRDECGFDGYSITDMAASDAAFYMVYDDAYYAGTDLFLGTGSKTALDNWKDDPNFAHMIRESCHRVLYVIANFSCVMNGISSSTKVVDLTPWWENLLNGLAISSGLIAGISAACYIGLSILKHKED